MRYSEIINESLDEGIFDTVGTIAKNAAAKVGHSVLGAMGSSKSDGANKRITAANQLMRMYQEYLGSMDQKATTESLLGFINNKFPQFAKPMDDIIKNWANGKGNMSPVGQDTKSQDAGTTGAAPLNAKQQAFADRSTKLASKPQAASSNLTGYQNTVMNQISTDLRNPNPDRVEVIKLVKELINHAKDYGGAEKSRVVQYLKQLKKNDDIIRKIPDLARMTLEARNRLINFATYLVENELNSKKSLNEAYNVHYLVESDIIPRSVLDAIFKQMAGVLINSGQVQFSMDKKKDDHHRNSDHDDSHGYRMKNDPTFDKNQTTNLSELSNQFVQNLGKYTINAKHVETELQSSTVNASYVKQTMTGASKNLNTFLSYTKTRYLPAVCYKAVFSGIEFSKDTNNTQSNMTLWKKPLDIATLTKGIKNVELEDDAKAHLLSIAEASPTFGKFMDTIGKDNRLHFFSDTMIAILASVK